MTIRREEYRRYSGMDILRNRLVRKKSSNVDLRILDMNYSHKRKRGRLPGNEWNAMPPDSTEQPSCRRFLPTI